MIFRYFLAVPLISCLFSLIHVWGRPTNVTILEKFCKCKNVNNNIEKITLQHIDLAEVTCNITYVSVDTRTYKVKLMDGRKTCFTVTMNRSFTRQGQTLILKFTGEVIRGYMKGSQFLNLQFFQVDETEKCKSEPGITEENSITDILICTKNLPSLDPDFRSPYYSNSSPEIQSVSCTGKAISYYSPGLIYAEPAKPCYQPYC